MKIFCWNVQGLENPQTFKRFRHVLKLNNPLVVSVMETKLSKEKMEKVRTLCGFLNGIDVAIDCSRGGLFLA